MKGGSDAGRSLGKRQVIKIGHAGAWCTQASRRSHLAARRVEGQKRGRYVANAVPREAGIWGQPRYPVEALFKTDQTNGPEHLGAVRSYSV